MARIAGTQGPRTIAVDRDEEGYRTYQVMHLVEATGFIDAMNCPGLPLPGAFYSFIGEIDPFVWCRPGMGIRAAPESRRGARPTYYEVSQTFSNKPPSRDKERCNSTSVDDPLMEPMKKSGSFVKFTEEATKDRFGNPILNSAWEQIRGPQAEFDNNRPTVHIEQNVASLQLDLIAFFMREGGVVNDAPIWGAPYRSVRLTQASWQERYQGMCSVYYTRSFDFEVNIKVDPDTGVVSSGWDRDVLDEGTKVLFGRWGFGGSEGTGWIPQAGVDPSNPANYIRYTDRTGNPTRVILNGAGLPYDATGLTSGTDDDQPGNIHIEKYPEGNLLLLGIPAVL